MKKFISIVLVLLMATSGCISHNHSSTPSFNYPSDIKSLCEVSRENAKNCMQSCGMKISYNKDCEVVKRNGEQKINGYWSWREPQWNNMWVCGLTSPKGSGYSIQAGCNPKNGQEVNPKTLEHENGHYILMSINNDWTHNPTFTKCFANWNEPKVKCREMSLNGQRVLVDFIMEEDVVTREFAK
jgi:hypothetical protein